VDACPLNPGNERAPQKPSPSGALTRLPPHKLEQLLEGVGSALDAMGGSFTMRYATVAVTAAVA
jgi:hypothetical protein